MTTSGFDPLDKGPSKLGYAKNMTYYATIERLVNDDNSGYGSAGGTGLNLKCNGELSRITSKIGLISADEAAYAGYAYRLDNSGTYLQENSTGDSWWTISPCYYYSYGATICDISRYIFSSRSTNFKGIRPVISLKSSTTFLNRSGTSEDPYVIDQK